MKGKYKRREATQVQALQLSGLTTLDKLLTWPGAYFLPLPVETMRSTSQDSNVWKTHVAALYIHVRDC